MNIQNTLTYIATFTELENVVKDATEGITWLGYRYIQVRGHKGLLHIDDLAIKVMAIFHYRFDFDEKERAAGKRLSELVDRLYKSNDTRGRTNIIAVLRDQVWMLRKMIEGRHYFFFPKLYWSREQYREFYKHYTKEQYEKIFDKPFPFNSSYFNIGLPGYKTFIIEDTDALQKLLSSNSQLIKTKHNPINEDNAKPATKNLNRLPYHDYPLDDILLCFSNYLNLDAIVNRSQQNISFFGYRYITVKDYDFTIPIDALAAKVMEMIKSRFDFTEEERAMGRRIVEKINTLYVENDAKKVNWITRLFCIIRDLWKYLSTPKSMNHRYHWFTQKENEVFEFYTPEQYERAFHASIPAHSIAKTRRVGFNNLTIYRPLQAAVS